MSNNILDFEEFISNQTFDIKKYLKALMEINKPSSSKDNEHSQLNLK